MPATRRGRGEFETTPAAVARDDAYIYLLVISLVAMIIGCVFLYLDWDSFTPGKPAPVNIQPAPRGAGGIGGPNTPPPPGTKP